ncbi:glycosyltransferase [Algoriphagus namhaensis]
MAPSPLVSICCITFNHGSFIKDALEGFLAQKTNFPFEILIYDDASTDGNIEILKEYAAKYPDLIHLEIAEENRYSDGIRAMNIRYNLPRAKGKYIALCEGDDYWTDPEKLQKQVDFLEQHSEYSACVHGAKIYNEYTNSFEHSKYENRVEDKDLGMFRIFEESGGVYPTCSLVFRKDKLVYPKDLMHFSGGDLILIIFLATQGRIRFMQEVMAVYRIHQAGVYQGERKNLLFYLSNRKELKYFYRELSPYLNQSNKIKLSWFRCLNNMSMVYLRMKMAAKNNSGNGD